MNNNLYSILEVPNTASIQEIKKNFKRLALKHHPDKQKNKNESHEQFNKIRIAYEILSNPERKEKYDKMHSSEQTSFIKTIMSFITEITNPSTIKTFLDDKYIVDNLKEGNINNISKYIIKKVLDEINDFHQFNLDDIFINNTSKNNSKNTSKNNTISVYSNTYNTSISISKHNHLNVKSSIKVSLEDIYNNKLKQIIIKNNKGEKSYNIPLYDPIVIINGAGDIDENNNIGDLILQIKCKKDKKFKKINYDLYYTDFITLYDLFVGFNKEIDCFGKIINIASSDPLKEYKFDGNCIMIKLDNHGIYNGESRGDLYIELILYKDCHFYDNLKSFKL